MESMDSVVKLICLTVQILSEIEDDKIELSLFENDEDETIHAMLLEAVAMRETIIEEGTKILKYFIENVVPSLTLSEFRSHFRVSKSTVEHIVGIIGGVLPQRDNGRPAIGVDKTVLLGLWSLANHETFLQIGERFDVGREHALEIFTDFCTGLCAVRCAFIQWPSSNNLASIVLAFQRTAGFPGVVATIDSCHIPIKAPRFVRHYYVNRRNIHSINLMACVDDTMAFTDIFVGKGGSVSDATVYRSSPLFSMLENDGISSDYHIIGDGDFPMSTYLLTPYGNDPQLTDVQINYNSKHNAIRTVVKKAFGLLKSKFRRLRYLDITNPVNRNKIITAACVLHNIYIKRQDWDDSEMEFTEETDDEECDSDVSSIPQEALAKRDAIASMLSP